MEKADYQPHDDVEGAFAFLHEEGDEEAIDIVRAEQYDEFEDRFTQIEQVGEGALKVVSRGYDSKMKRYVAIARIKDGLDDQYDDSLRHEAWLTASLQHPNIIKVYTMGMDQERRAYYTMDLKEGKSLVDVVREEERIDVILEAFLKVCDAVSYAHSQGVIHLDLKPENVQCSRYGEVLVCDWGLSKRLYQKGVEVPEMDHLQEVAQRTLYGEVKGTLGYIAPEQIEVEGEKDQRTDVYALGGILYYLFTGKASISGSKEQVLLKTLNGDVISPRKRTAQCRATKMQERIVMKAMAKAPQDRYESVELLRDDVRNSLLGNSTSVDPPNILFAFYRFILRHKKPFLTGGLVAASVLVLVWYYSITLQQSEEAIKTLSNQVEVQASEVNSLEDQVQHSKAEQRMISRKLSADMMKIAATKRNDVMWRLGPMKYIAADLELVQSLYQLYPKEPTIRYEWYFLNFVTLNFKAICEQEYRGGSEFINYCVKIAQLYPEYEYSPQNRPKAKVLRYLLRAIHKDLKESSDKKVYSALIGALLRYNLNSIEGAVSNESIVEALRCLNVSNLSFFATYQDRGVEIRSDEKIRTFHGKDHEDIIGFFEVQRCKIKAPELSLYELHMMHARKVDLSQVDKISVVREVNISGLHEIIIKQGSIDKEELRSRLRSNYKKDYIVTVVE